MKAGHSLFTGTIEHRRFSPKKNSFTYGVCYYFLDLKEIRNVFKIPLLFTYNRPGLLSFWRKDYLGNKNRSLDSAVRDEILKQKHVRPKGPIWVLTNISYFGYCFNPVTFYYCYGENGETLDFIVSEITNTPWGEKRRQVFSFSEQETTTFKFSKDFHVSPFMPMNIDYTWVFRKPDKKIYVFMQNRSAGTNEVLFDSTLHLERIPLNLKNVIWSFLSFPFVTFKTMLAIHFQALKLYLKRVPFYPHPPGGEGL
jgi:uncharacterized protein